MEHVPPNLAAPVGNISSTGDSSSTPGQSAHLAQQKNTPEIGINNLAQISDLKLAVETLNRNDLLATFQELTDRQLKDLIFERATFYPNDEHSSYLRGKLMAKMKLQSVGKTFKLEAFTDLCINKLAVWNGTMMDHQNMDYFANVWFIQNIAIDVDRLGIHGCTIGRWAAKRKAMMAIYKIAYNVMALPFLNGGNAAHIFRHDPFSRAVCLIRQSSVDMKGQGQLYEEGVKDCYDILIQRANFVGNFQGLQSALYTQPIPNVIGYGEPYTEVPCANKRGKKNLSSDNAPSHKKQRTVTDGGADEPPIDPNLIQTSPLSSIAYPSTTRTHSFSNTSPYVSPAHMASDTDSSSGRFTGFAPAPDTASPILENINQDLPVLNNPALEQGPSSMLVENNNGNTNVNLPGHPQSFGNANSPNDSSSTGTAQSSNGHKSDDSQSSLQSKSQGMTPTYASKIHSQRGGNTAQIQPVQQTYQAYIDHGILGTAPQQPQEIYFPKVPDYADVFEDVGNALFDPENRIKSAEQEKLRAPLVARRIENAAGMIVQRAKHQFQFPMGSELQFRIIQRSLFSMVWVFENALLNQANNALSAEVTRRLNRQTMVGCFLQLTKLLNGRSSKRLVSILGLKQFFGGGGVRCISDYFILSFSFRKSTLMEMFLWRHTFLSSFTTSKTTRSMATRTFNVQSRI